MTNRDLSHAAWALGLTLAVGIAGAGLLVGRSLAVMRTADRHVTVRGFSEREVPADLALWPIVFNATGDDLTAVQAELDRDEATVRAFLAEQGFAADDISVSIPRVTDLQAYGNRQQGSERYMAEVTVTLRSSDVERVRTAMQTSGVLVREGVAVLRSYEYNPQFLFTRLEAIKPEMIAEATRDARRAAEQFAHDSGSRVGAIRSAQQGYFSVEDRDAFSPEYKRVRVVTTVEYFLDGGR
jgi:hypothetical protein